MPVRKDEPVDAASPAPFEAATGPSPGPASSEWAQAARRRHAEGMDNLYRRGVTDTMLMRFYIGWNGRALVHPMRDINGHHVEVPLGEAIRIPSDDPEGVLVIHNAIQRHNVTMMERRRAAAQDPVQRPYPSVMDGDDPMLDRTPYAREDMRYSHQRQEPPAYTSSSRFGADAPGSVPSQMASDRDLDRERHRYDARDDVILASESQSTDPCDLPSLLWLQPRRHSDLEQRMRCCLHTLEDQTVTWLAATAWYPDRRAPIQARQMSSHDTLLRTVFTLVRTGDHHLGWHPVRLAMQTSTAPELRLPCQLTLPRRSSHRLMHRCLPTRACHSTPAMMEDEAQVVDPALQRSPLPSAASAHSTPAPAPRSLAQPVPDSQKQREKSAGSNGTDAPRSNGTDVNAGKGKEDESEVQDREKVREQARKMARSMRPDASDAEIERLVENFIGGGRGVGE